MGEEGFFTILDTVDSTNNYAMGQVHEGLAKHGMLWFANEQTAGKGQRGKAWSTEKGKNIVMSLVLEANRLKIANPFHLSAAVALTCFEFFKTYAGDETKIKWPNDLFWRDRKAGGILIENKFTGKHWKWAVIGIGININQTRFDHFAVKPVSLKEITGRTFNTIKLAKELYDLLMQHLGELKPLNIVMQQYNDHLYKLNKQVTLKNKDVHFEVVIKSVGEQGQLITMDTTEHRFNFGEVEWLL